MQGGAKTRLSQSSVEVHSLLVAVLRSWQQQTLYGKPEDYVFASYRLGGQEAASGFHDRRGLSAARRGEGRCHQG